MEPFQSLEEIKSYKEKLVMSHAKVNYTGKIEVFWNEE